MSLSVLFAFLATDGGLVANLEHPTVKASVFVTFISFGLYLMSRAAAPLLRRRGAHVHRVDAHRAHDHRAHDHAEVH
jgi:hypothetical protein